MSRKRDNERGSILVEAAISLLLLLLLMGGIFDFGRIYGRYQTITNAAREGARYAASPFSATGVLPTTSQVTSLINSQLSAAGVDPTQAIINVSQADVITYNSIPVTYSTVTISAPVNYVFFNFSQGQVTAEARMRNETN